MTRQDVSYYDSGYFETPDRGWGPQDRGIFFGIAVALRRAFPEAESVLDAGCGTGYLLEHLHNQFPRAAGVEWSEHAVRHPVAPGLSVVQADVAARLPFADASFDLVVTWQVLEHLDLGTVVAALAELHRVSRRWAVHSICLAPPESRERVDPGHTLLRSSIWWEQQFRAFGMDADAEHRALLASEFGESPELFVFRHGSRPDARLTTPGPGTYELGDRIVQALAGSESGACALLDAGCYQGAHTRDLHCSGRLFVDCLDRGAPRPFLRADLHRLRGILAPDTFDVACCLDVIEHLERDDGFLLIQDLERVARRRVVYFTPLGPLWMGEAEGPDRHRIAWWPEDFERLGYVTWVFPEFHQFAEDYTHGAFWAWKTLSGSEVLPRDLQAVVGC